MMTRTTRLLSAVSLVLLVAGVGCAGRDRTPDEILEEGALAYHVAVYL